MNALRTALLVALAFVASCSVQHPSVEDSAASAGTIDVTPTPGRMVDTLVGLGSTPVDSSPAMVAATEPPAATGLDDFTALANSLVIPVQGVIASQLRDTYTAPRAGHSHEALDILAPRGTPVLAAADGKLTKLHQSVAGGLMVYAADVSDQFIFMYGHLDRYADGVYEGQPLKQGQIIGYVGTTGNAPAGTPHLHFAIARGKPSVAWWKGVPLNPYPLLRPGSG